MGFGQFVDHVGQLATAPIFKAVDFAAAVGDQAFVAFEHGWNLLALIGMDQKHDFIMTHELSLWIELPTASCVV